MGVTGDEVEARIAKLEQELEALSKRAAALPPLEAKPLRAQKKDLRKQIDAARAQLRAIRYEGFQTAVVAIALALVIAMVLQYLGIVQVHELLPIPRAAMPSMPAGAGGAEQFPAGATI